MIAGRRARWSMLGVAAALTAGAARAGEFPMRVDDARCLALSVSDRQGAQADASREPESAAIYFAALLSLRFLDDDELAGAIRNGREGVLASDVSARARDRDRCLREFRNAMARLSAAGFSAPR